MPTIGPARFAVALVLLSASSGPMGSHSAPRPPRLFKDARQILAFAAVVRGAEAVGRVIRYREDEVGYLRVRVPIDRATEFSESDGIESVTADMDDSYPYRMTPNGRLKTELTADTVKWPPKWSDYPLRNPYSPIADIDAGQFRKLHPTWDGRGVTIALLDGNLDLLLPEFQIGDSLDGKRVPKVADYLNLTDPIDDGAMMPQWVDMRATVTASGRRVSHQGKTYTTPCWKG